MRVEVTSGTVSAALLGVTHPVSLGLVAEAIKKGAPVATAGYLDDSNFTHDSGADSTISAEGVRALIGAPLWSAGKLRGMLFAAEREQRTFGVDATELMVSLASHAAVAIENAAKSDRLMAANRDLEQRSRQLEQILRWDESLTQVVLQGGGVAHLTNEISRIVRSEVTFERCADVNDSNRTLRPIVVAGSVLGYLRFDQSSPPDLTFLERTDSALALACMAECQGT